MYKLYSKDLKKAVIIQVIIEGHSPRHVSRMFNVPERTVRRWVKEFKDSLK